MLPVPAPQGPRRMEGAVVATLGIYVGYIEEEDFRRFCAAIAAGPKPTRVAAKVILQWLTKEKANLISQRKMIKELLERYG